MSVSTISRDHDGGKGHVTSKERAVLRPASLNIKYIPELDGVRALAILAVLAVHFFAASPSTVLAGEKLGGWQKGLYIIAAHGWLGVDLFFVLSGFLITGILLDSRGRDSYFYNFWVRRALRILPLVFVVVAILTLVYRPHWLFVLMALFFAVDFAPSGLGNNAMGPLWSLAVEEQFYLVWPFLIFFLRPRALVAVTVAIIAAEPFVRAVVGGPLDVLWFRVDGLAMGALIAIYVRSRLYSQITTLRASACATISAAALLALDLHGHGTSYAFRITEANLIFGSLIATSFALTGSKWLSPLRSRAATFIANTSFCAYLIHVSLLEFARFLGVGSGISNPFAAAAVQASVAIPATFLLAAFSRKYFEMPFLRLKDHFAPTSTRPVISTSAVDAG